MSDGGIFDEPDEGSHDADMPPVEPTIVTPVINKSKKQLLCVADETGNPLVAVAQYDNYGKLGLLEPYRRPTQKEWQHLSQTGQVVKQGNSIKVNSVGATDVSISTGWSKPVKIGAAVLGLAAVFGGGFLIFKKSRNKNPEEPMEPIQPDDDDDDDDDDDGDED